MGTDVYLTTEGDIEIGSNGDLKLVQSSEEILQGIMFRCKTVRGDFLLSPGCGADLESLIGEANDAGTGARLEQFIIDALTHDGFIDQSNLQVTAVPTSLNTITAVVIVTINDQPAKLLVSVDLVEGEVRLTR